VRRSSFCRSREKKISACRGKKKPTVSRQRIYVGEEKRKSGPARGTPLLSVCWGQKHLLRKVDLGIKFWFCRLEDVFKQFGRAQSGTESETGRSNRRLVGGGWGENTGLSRAVAKQKPKSSLDRKGPERPTCEFESGSGRRGASGWDGQEERLNKKFGGGFLRQKKTKGTGGTPATRAKLGEPPLKRARKKKEKGERSGPK